MCGGVWGGVLVVVCVWRWGGERGVEMGEVRTNEGIKEGTRCMEGSGMFSGGKGGCVNDNDVWVQRHCSVGRLMCAQLPLDSQV